MPSKPKNVSALVVQTKHRVPVKLSGVDQLTSNSKKNISSIHKVLNDSKLHIKIIDNISTTQKTFQELIFPEWILKSFRDRELKPGGIIMDRWWYVWNICMAFVPGLLVLAVTQYYRKEAKEFYEKQQLMDRERLISHTTEIQVNSPTDAKESSRIDLFHGSNGSIMQGEPSIIDDLLRRLEFLENRLNIASEDRTRGRTQSGISKRIDERKRKQLMDHNTVVDKDLDSIPKDEYSFEHIQKKLYAFIEGKREEIKQYLSDHKTKEEIETEKPNLKQRSKVETVDEIVRVNDLKRNDDSLPSSQIDHTENMNMIRIHNILSKMKKIWIRE